MSAYAGKDGFFKLDGGQVAYMDNYSLQINAGTADITSLGDEWKKSLATQKDWSGSASGTLDLADEEQAAVLAMFTGSSTIHAQSLSFGLGGNSSYTGSATISSITIGASVSDKITFSFNFTGDGPLTLVNQYDTNRVAAPGFSVDGNNTDSVYVTITDATTDASIYYTTDGSAPTSASTEYESPIHLSVAGEYTVRAVGIKSGLQNSIVTSVVVNVAE